MKIVRQYLNSNETNDDPFCNEIKKSKINNYSTSNTGICDILIKSRLNTSFSNLY